MNDLIKAIAVELNKKIDLPFLNEAQEEALIELILSILLGLIPGMKDKAATKI